MSIFVISVQKYIYVPHFSSVPVELRENLYKAYIHTVYLIYTVWVVCFAWVSSYIYRRKPVHISHIPQNSGASKDI